MGSTFRHRRLRQWLIPTAAFGFAALLSLSISSSADRMVAASFASVIEKSLATQPLRVASNSGLAAKQVSGSEDYWLSAKPGDRNVQLARLGPDVGDTIALRLRGRDVALQVIAVEPLLPGVTRLDTRQTPGRRLRITARDGENSQAQPVSFIVRVAPRNSAREL